MIPLTDVVSSTIKAVGYGKQGLLVVFLSNPSKVYAYGGCTQNHAELLLAAASAGKHFATHIKGLPFTTFDLDDLPDLKASPRFPFDPIDWFAAAKAVGAFFAPPSGLVF
ncbi:KTSC domain-containing protein [Crenobacter sp. SG2305]|uniref:KTSC domain-containing protein n=1 Tax=Crenobacter oryzisoli TaxID=3056844 RepID=UPI0025AA386D|nr:KTSC domain-containing protein [Crenobacter sp. SG2305]MDN0082506.1 KTSC domain-containing protein [Crenobacter sp. SG2305]